MLKRISRYLGVDLSQLQLIIFILVLIVLVLLGAFFSCAETGLMSVNRYRLRHKARMKQRFAIRILQLLKRPDRLLGTILIGSNFASMFAASLMTLIAYHFAGERGVVIATTLLTFLMLTFAEIAPKTLAAIYPESVARLFVIPIYYLQKIMYPLVWMVNVLANGLLRLFRVPLHNHMIEPLSREELRSIVRDTTSKISEQYQHMLIGILDLNNLTVDDVMVPRHEMKAIDVTEPWEKMIETMIQLQQDWIPFYRENINQLIGVLYIRDLSKLFLSKATLSKELFLEFIQEPYFVPMGTALSIQLAFFQQAKDKVAFVVDEYGELQGSLTLNDILEEIVGEFNTSVQAGKLIQPQPDGSFLVEGALSIRELNRITNFELPLSGPKTVNGLIVEYLEALPHIGTGVLIAQYPVEIIQVKENRVKLARVFPRLEDKAT